MKLREIIRAANALFAAIVLAIFYFIVIGFSAFLLGLAKITQVSRKKKSYWKNAEQRTDQEAYYRSPY